MSSIESSESKHYPCSIFSASIKCIPEMIFVILIENPEFSNKEDTPSATSLHLPVGAGEHLPVWLLAVDNIRYVHKSIAEFHESCGD